MQASALSRHKEEICVPFPLFLLLRPLFFCFFLLLSSCGGGGGSDGGSSSSFCRIEGGVGCSINEGVPVALLDFVRADGRRFLCSATFVTLDDLVTAAHCLPPDTIAAVVEVNATENYEVIGGRAHPLYAGGFIGDTRSDLGFYDVGMITINGVRNVGPAPLIISNTLSAGESVNAIGFGTDNAGSSISERDPSQLLRAADFIIDDIEPGGRAFASFNSSASICPGDSGGPATQSLNGVTGIVGIASFGIFIGQSQCSRESIGAWGNVQDPDILSFILSYAPDVATL